jgi:signal transduction histidine kinase
VTLRGRLLAGGAVGVAIALAVAGAVVYAWTRSSLYAQFDAALAARAEALAAQVELDGDRISPEIDPASSPDEAFELWGRGQVLLRSKDLRGDLVATAAPVVEVTLGDGRRARQITHRFLPRLEPDEAPRPRPEVVLAVARATAEVDASVGRIATVLAGAGVLGIALALAILAVGIRIGLAPLRALATGIAMADLTTRLDVAGAPAELRAVVARLNELLARLARAFERERELTAELAHELRTPLAGIRATIEVTLDRERPAERYRAALVDALAITADTERVVEALLALARLDAGVARPRSAPIDLDELVRGLAGPAAARAIARDAALVTRLVPVTIASDAEMLRVVVGNLLDNAVTYVDPGGVIEVVLEAGALVIRNTGCALAPAEVERVFERFWRGDQARPSGVHAGLGLAVVKQLLELLGGGITVAVEAGQFVATVRLPGPA